MRILLGPTDSCKKSEAPLSWNAQGPKGDPGPPADLSAITELVNSLQQAISGLSQRVANVENSNRWQHINITVDCGAGETVAAALQEAAAYVSANIGIAGVCHEAVQINKRDTYLYGVNSGDGLALPESQQGPVLSIGAMGVGVGNLTLTGALTVDPNSVAYVSNTTIAGSGGARNIREWRCSQSRE